MKFHIGLKFLVFAAIAFSFTSSVKVDEILANHLDAIGQKNKENLGLVKQEGVYSLGGMIDVRFINYYYNGSLRLEYYYEGEKKPAVTVYTPDTAWKTTPWDLKSVTSLSAYELNRAREWAQLTGVIANYKTLGYELTFDEKLNSNSKDLIITANKPDKVTKIHAWINPRNHLVSKTQMVEWYGAKEQVTTTTFSDYENVNGVMIAKSIVETRNGIEGDKITIDRIEAGLKFKKKLFKKP
jgi:hypothetical protein